MRRHHARSARADTTKAAEYSARDRRRLVVAACRRVRRSHGEDAGIRSRRPRGCAFHTRVRRRAIVHAIARGAADGTLSASARGRRRAARLSAGKISCLHGSARASRLLRRLHAQRMGPRSLRAGGPHAKPCGPAFSDFETFLRGRRCGPAVRVLVRQPGSSSALRRRIRCGIGHRPRVDSRPGVPARHAGSTPRSGGLFFRSAALRSRARRDSRTAASARGARQHTRRDHRRQRHAVSASEGERVRRAARACRSRCDGRAARRPGSSAMRSSA